MIALPYSDGRAEENEPAHQQEGGRLSPARGLVQHIASEHLPSDEDRHQNEPGPGDPKRRKVNGSKNPGQRGKTIAHRSKSPAGKRAGRSRPRLVREDRTQFIAWM